MRSNFNEAKISLMIVSIILTVSLLFFFAASMFTTMGYKALRNASAVNAADDDIVIVIDAGHGGEDPGAVANGVIEKDVNIEIALYLSEMLNAYGYKTVLTRSGDYLLYNKGQESQKKYYDVRNREEIANKFSNSLFVSIHMNKFPQEYCKGLQVFYSENNQDSKRLAEIIQSNSKLLQSYNNRQIKSGNDTIYLMKELKMPAVLVECGFISNFKEAALLKETDYKQNLAFLLSCSISDFLEKNYEDRIHM